MFTPHEYTGDFVDRGSFSVEVILSLLAWKVLYPQGMHLSRGNHEAHSMNKIYGFDGEVGAQAGWGRLMRVWVRGGVGDAG